ncbi:transglycosylase domain-containing protein, partial [Patescibacteria group bacterium]|nr:transglycosylase domain-containing protein [Patescibacteria group bacterium]
GGSTITQQYVKNAFLSPEKTYTRKLKELILAIRLEQEFDKQKILELYLNKIPYGNNAYGIEKAAQIYFGTHAKDLTITQAAVLASLPQAPSYYNPYGQHRYSELTRTLDSAEIAARNIHSESNLKDNEFDRGLIGKNTMLDEEHSIYIQGRTDLVLKAMEKEGYITSAEKEESLKELRTIEFNKYQETIKAPHFVFYILSQLEDKYGKEIVEQGGLKVYTTLDPKLQEAATQAVEEVGATNTENYNVKNSALVSLDPKTGEILAMVGSKDYFSQDIDGAVNIVTQYRQPGSSFKPIVYAQAFYNRYAPASVIFDVKTRFGDDWPNNYDGKFLGPISIRRALGQSRNIPAIKTFFLAGEQGPIIELAQRMGLHFLDPDREYGSSLALGTAETRPLDMATAFGVFASGGILHEPVGIIKVENSAGDLLEENKPDEGKEVLDPQIAYLINNILSDKSVGLGENLVIPGQVTAAKTGTSNIRKDDKPRPWDLWTIGYTPGIVTAVWSGNNSSKDGYPAQNASGYSNSAPIWKKFMTAALGNNPSQDFSAPEGITTKSVSRLTGKLPGPNTPPNQIVEEVFASFSVPTEIDDSISQIPLDTRNMKLANEYCPPKFVKDINFLTLKAIAPINTWQEGVNAWLAENTDSFLSATGPDGPSTDIVFGNPPSQESELCTKNNADDAPQITISSPANGTMVQIGSNITVNIDIIAANTLEKVEFYLDSQFKFSSTQEPYTGIIRLPKLEKDGTKHTITAKVTDIFGYTAEESINIKALINPPPGPEIVPPS